MATISHLQEKHDFSDRAIVESLKATTAETIDEFINAMHDEDHAFAGEESHEVSE